MEKRKKFNSIYCAMKVTGRQHVVQCDGCGEWQHRKCNTGKEPFNTEKSTRPMQYADMFLSVKIENFIGLFFFDIFTIFSQNIIVYTRLYTCKYNIKIS